MNTNPIDRRDFLGLTLLMTLLPRFSSAQGVQVDADVLTSAIRDLAKENTKLYDRIILDSLATTLSEKGQPGSDALVRIFDLSTRPGLSNRERELALEEIERLAALHKPLDAEVFGRLALAVKPPVPEAQVLLDQIPTAVNWGVNTISVFGGAYGWFTKGATVALGVAGIGAEPALKKLLATPEIAGVPGLPARASDEHFRLITANVLAAAHAEPWLQQAGPRNLLLKTTGVDLSPKFMTDMARLRAEAALKTIGVEPSKDGKISKKDAIAGIQKSLDRIERKIAERRALPEQPPNLKPADKAALVQRILDEVDYHVAEIRGAGIILGGLATVLGADPKLGRSISTAATELGSILKAEALFDAKRIGVFTLAGTYVTAALAFASIIFGGESTDKAILLSLEGVHKKLDRILASNYRLEEQQTQILKNLSIMFQELLRGNGEARAKLGEVQTSIDQVQKGANLETRQTDILALRATFKSLELQFEVPNGQRDKQWESKTRLALLAVAGFAEGICRKASFSGDTQLVGNIQQLGNELRTRDDFQLSLGFLPQLGAFTGVAKLAALSRNGVANIPNPSMWAAGVSCYLEAGILSGGAGVDPLQLRKFWATGLQIREAIFAATSAETVRTLSDQFLRSAGVTTDSGNAVIRTTKAHWEIDTSLIGLHYRALRNFIRDKGLELHQYALSERPKDKHYLPTETKNLLRKHGDYFGVSEETSGTFDRQFEISNCPVDAAVRVGILKLQDYGEETRGVSKRRIIAVRLTKSQNVSFSAVQDLDLHEASQIEGNKYTVRERKLGPSGTDPTRFLDLCQIMAYVEARSRIRKELPTELDVRFTGWDFGVFDGIGRGLALIGLLTRVRHSSSELPWNAERLSDFTGLFSAETIKNRLKRAIVEYTQPADQPTFPANFIIELNGALVPLTDEPFIHKNLQPELWDPNTLAERVITRLCDELVQQSDELAVLAEKTPANSAYTLVDETMRRIAGYMVAHQMDL